MTDADMEAAMELEAENSEEDNDFEDDEMLGDEDDEGEDANEGDDDEAEDDDGGDEETQEGVDPNPNAPDLHKDDADKKAPVKLSPEIKKAAPAPVAKKEETKVPPSDKKNI